MIQAFPWVADRASPAHLLLARTAPEFLSLVKAPEHSVNSTQPSCTTRRETNSGLPPTAEQPATLVSPKQLPSVRMVRRSSSLARAQGPRRSTTMRQSLTMQYRGPKNGSHDMMGLPAVTTRRLPSLPARMDYMFTSPETVTERTVI